MHIIDEISTIADKWTELGQEVPESAIVGVNRWKEILNELTRVQRISDSAASHITTVSCYHAHGVCIIKCNTEVHPDHVSLGRMTLTDIIVEDILLDSEIPFDIGDSN